MADLGEYHPYRLLHPDGPGTDYQVKLEFRSLERWLSHTLAVALGAKVAPPVDVDPGEPPPPMEPATGGGLDIELASAEQRSLRRGELVTLAGNRTVRLADRRSALGSQMGVVIGASKVSAERYTIRIGGFANVRLASGVDLTLPCGLQLSGELGAAEMLGEAPGSGDFLVAVGRPLERPVGGVVFTALNFEARPWVKAR